MKLSTFPTFLAFLTQALCFPAPASNPWQGLDIPPYLRERLRPPTVGREANDLTGRTCSISARHPPHGRRWLARWCHNEPTAWAEGRPDAGPGTVSVSDMAASAGKNA
jgi:hypothetical protein